MALEINNIDEILNIRQVCRYLKINRGTLRKLKIPYLKIRRRILYRKRDLEIFVLDNMKVKN